jgi:hypothetical protein
LSADFRTFWDRWVADLALTGATRRRGLVGVHDSVAAASVVKVFFFCFAVMEVLMFGFS